MAELNNPLSGEQQTNSVMKYYVTILRSGESEKEFENDNGKRYSYFKVRNPFVNSNFKSLNNKQKKNFVKGFLNRASRDDLNTDKVFEKKERVVVNPQGAYKKEDRVFDEQVKIPKHLRRPAPKKRVKGRG